MPIKDAETERAVRRAIADSIALVIREHFGRTSFLAPMARVGTRADFRAGGGWRATMTAHTDDHDKIARMVALAARDFRADTILTTIGVRLDPTPTEPGASRFAILAIVDCSDGTGYVFHFLPVDADGRFGHSNHARHHPDCPDPNYACYADLTHSYPAS